MASVSKQKSFIYLLRTDTMKVPYKWLSNDFVNFVIFSEIQGFLQFKFQNILQLSLEALESFNKSIKCRQFKPCAFNLLL